jgi:hypothetical protein
MCECPPEAHFVGWACPLFQQEWICGSCCQIECLRTGVEKRFSEKLGRELTREELDASCKSCGKNYAKINDDLADRMEQGGSYDTEIKAG